MLFRSERARPRAKDQPHPRYVPAPSRVASRALLTVCLLFSSGYFYRYLVGRLLWPWLRHPQVDRCVGGRGSYRGNMTRRRLLPAAMGRRVLSALPKLRWWAIVVAISYTNLLYIPAVSTNFELQTFACMRGDKANNNRAAASTSWRACCPRPCPLASSNTTSNMDGEVMKDDAIKRGSVQG